MKMLRATKELNEYQELRKQDEGLFKKKDLKVLIQKFKVLADQGNSVAMFMLALLLYEQHLEEEGGDKSESHDQCKIWMDKARDEGVESNHEAMIQVCLDIQKCWNNFSIHCKDREHTWTCNDSCIKVEIICRYNPNESHYPYTQPWFPRDAEKNTEWNELCEPEGEYDNEGFWHPGPVSWIE